MSFSRILQGEMNTEQKVRERTDSAQDDVTRALCMASELTAKGDNRAARRLLRQAKSKSTQDDKVRLDALDRSIRMDIVAKIALSITATALAIVAYISLLH